MHRDALDTFVVIRREGGILNAPRVLRRSQPAIARRIALIEQEHHGILIIRIARQGMRMFESDH